MAGRPVRKDDLESPRTKVWYRAVRRAVALQYGQPEEGLKPDEVHRLIKEKVRQHSSKYFDQGDESKLWHKYAAGKHSPTKISQHKATDGSRLRTYEWVDQYFPGTAQAYLHGPASIWAIIEAWSIRDAYRVLQSVVPDMSSSELISIEELTNGETMAASESWLSPHQLRIYWSAEQLSLTVGGFSRTKRLEPKLELSMAAFSAGIACARFMDWISPLERLLTNEACMGWIKHNHGLDLLDFRFCRELCHLPEIQVASMKAGLQDDFYPIEMV